MGYLLDGFPSRWDQCSADGRVIISHGYRIVYLMLVQSLLTGISGVEAPRRRSCVQGGQENVTWFETIRFREDQSKAFGQRIGISRPLS